MHDRFLPGGLARASRGGHPKGTKLQLGQSAGRQSVSTAASGSPKLRSAHTAMPHFSFSLWPFSCPPAPQAEGTTELLI